LKAAELIPVYRLDARRCILLDSGLDWEQEALREVLEQKGLTPVGAIGTHAHVDHIGNHAWLRETYGTRLCMSAGEAALVSSSFMRKGDYHALSLGTMKSVWNGTVFPVDEILGPEDGEIEFMGAHFQIHHTPGHSQDHICIGTADGICYVGDLLMAGKVRRNAQLPYHLVHRAARDAMVKIRDFPGYSGYIVAHRKILDDLTAAVEKNMDMLDWISEEILGLMEEPVTREELMSQVVERNQLFTSDERKLMIYERAVQSFVDDLKDTGRISVEVKRGVRRYQRL